MSNEQRIEEIVKMMECRNDPALEKHFRLGVIEQSGAKQSARSPHYELNGERISLEAALRGPLIDIVKFCAGIKKAT